MPPSPPQRILIVGGASGIGAALTISIIRRSTAQVFVFDKNIDYSPSGPLAALIAYPNRMYGHEADVTIPAEREHAVATCIRRDVLGGIDTVVYCAGVITPIERIENMDVMNVEGTFAVNVFGAMGMVLLSLQPFLICTCLRYAGTTHNPSLAHRASISPSQRGLWQDHILDIRMRSGCYLSRLESLLHIESCVDAVHQLSCS
jgi:NAD(P)-dependent dehydrogenase (short-subunit alcohol dehydrogenase family)